MEGKIREPIPNYRMLVRRFVVCRTQNEFDLLALKIENEKPEEKYEWFIEKTLPFGEGIVFVIAYDKPYEEKK